METKNLIFKSFREYGEYCKKKSSMECQYYINRQVKCDMSKKQIAKNMRNNRPVGYIYKHEI